MKEISKKKLILNKIKMRLKNEGNLIFNHSYLIIPITYQSKACRHFHLHLQRDIPL